VIPGQDDIRLDGAVVMVQVSRIVVLLNKPPGYLCSCRRGREEGRSVTDLVPLGRRLYPVGRLDRDSEGLLLLTDDGELALHLAHPRYHKEKEYVIELDRTPTPDVPLRLVRGIELADGPARALRAGRRGSRMLTVVLTQGRKRQVRRMVEALGYRVVRLVRVRIAGLELGKLKPGEWRQLEEDEIRTRLTGRG
jgi:23S rRNA pseudouridine2605 synthase